MIYSEAQLKQKPKVLPTIFMGQWDAEKQTVSWTPRALPGKQGNKAATKEDAPAPAFEMVVARDGKISIQNSENLPTGQISTGGATARTGEAPQEPEKPEFLTGMHRFQKGSEISDPRIMRYLPVEATDIRAGAGLVLAGLVAQGRTDVFGVDHIDRGYAGLVEDLQALGATVTRTDEPSS